MKKGLFILVTFIVIPFAYPQETLTITTYYPAPYGVYKTLRLYPTSDAEIDTTQPCSSKGELIMRDSDSSMYVCDGSAWAPASKGTLECITGTYRGGKNGFITVDMFKPIYSKTATRTALMNDLLARGYAAAGPGGRNPVTQLFRDFGDDSTGFEVSSTFDAKKDEIFAIIHSHSDVATAGSGIVWKHSNTSPLVGSSTLDGTSYNFADVFTTEDVYETSEGDAYAPLIRCRADKGWIATGCSSNTWGASGGDEDSYILQNGCKGQQWGDNRVMVRCCRIVNTSKQSSTFYGDSYTGTHPGCKTCVW